MNPDAHNAEMMDSAPRHAAPLRTNASARLLTRLPFLAALACVVGGADASAAGGRTDINYTYWDAVADAPLRKLAEKFNSIHPEVHVTCILRPFVEYETWQRTQVLAGTQPEIMQTQGAWASDLGKKGLVVDFTPFLEAVSPETGVPWRDNFLMEYVDSMMDEFGRRYCITTSLVGTGVYYNKRLTAKIFSTGRLARTDMPSSRRTLLVAMRVDSRLLPDGTILPRTWPEWFALMDEMRDAGYIPLATCNNVDTGSSMNWLNDSLHDAIYRDKFEAIDVRVTNPDYTKLPVSDKGYGAGEIFDGEERAVAYKKGLIGPDTPEFEFISNLFKDFSRYWQAGANGASHDESRGMFYRQKAVCIIDGSWMIDLLPQELDRLEPEDQFDFGVFATPNLTREQCPYVDGSVRGVGGPGLVICVAKKIAPQKLEWAMRFLQFRTTVEADGFVRANANGSVGPPALRGVKGDPRYDVFSEAGLRTMQVTGLSGDLRAGHEWMAYMQMYIDGIYNFPEYRRLMKISWDNQLRLETEKWNWDFDLSTVETKQYGVDLERTP